MNVPDESLGPPAPGRSGSAVVPLDRYRPWSIRELDDVVPNGLRVVSLFSGCGGSSLGYRLSGYEVVAANEFIPIAAATYRANATPTTVVDERDVRTVSGHDLRERFGEIDLLDGSPPSASFSIAGGRAATWGQEKPYSSTRQRTDDLFDEYRADRRRASSPSVCRGERRRVRPGCRDRVRSTGRREAPLVGVPRRSSGPRRTVARGPASSTTDDHPRDPRRPRTGPGLPDSAPVETLPPRTALGDYVEGQIAPVTFNSIDGKRRSPDLPSLTVGAGTRTGNGKWSVSIVFAPPKVDPETGYLCPISERVRSAFPNASLRYLTLDELRRVASFPDDFVLLGSFHQRWERIGRAVPPYMMRAISGALVPVLSS